MLIARRRLLKAALATPALILPSKTKGAFNIFQTTRPVAYYSVWNKGFPTRDALMHVVMSDDGINWTTRTTYNTYTPHNSANMGAVDLMYYNGKIWINGSRGFDFSWTGTSVEIASSPDGDNFTYVASPDYPGIVSGGTMQEVWAQPWFIDDDGSVHMYLVACPNGFTPPYTNYMIDAQNVALNSWSAAIPITGTGMPSGWFNPYTVKIGSTYYMFYKNENGGSYPKYIEVATSMNRTSGFVPVRTGDWAGFGSPPEAPILRPNGNKWRLWLDYEGTGVKMFDSLTSDPIGAWSAGTSITVPFGTPEHGGIIANPFG